MRPATGMTLTQRGAAGEALFMAHALITSAGQLELFKPETDDDHDDFCGGRKGAVPAITLQIKTAYELASERVHFSVSVPAAGVRESPAFIYVIQFVDGVEVPATWVVPSPEWDRQVPLEELKDYGPRFEFYAHPSGADAMARWRIERAGLGRRLLEIIEGLPAGTRAPRLEGSAVARRRGRGPDG